MVHAGHTVLPHRYARYATARPSNSRGRQPEFVLCLRKSRRGDFRGTDAVQSRSATEPASCIRHGSAHVPRQHPRTNGVAYFLHAAFAAHRIDRARRRSAIPTRELRTRSQTSADPLQTEAGCLTCIPRYCRYVSRSSVTLCAAGHSSKNSASRTSNRSLEGRRAKRIGSRHRSAKAAPTRRADSSSAAIRRRA